MPKKKLAPMKRATIIVKGDVQRVGYRSMINSFGRRFGIVGQVGNLGLDD